MTFTMTYEERNRMNLDKLADNTKKAAYQWYQFCIDNKIDILIYETIRTEEQQRQNVANGKSQTMKSYHLVGQALDFVPAKSDKTVDWNGYRSADIKNAVAKAKELGFEWGGNWTSFVDQPHLQYNYKGYGTDSFAKAEVVVAEEKKEVVAVVKETGDAVIKAIQTTLNNRYKVGLVVDGYYGAKSKEALLRALQTELNKQYNAKLVVDGIFGAKTKMAIPVLQKGDKGNITYILQAMLYCLRYDPQGIDGIFGANTEAAVRGFQKASGLIVDSKAGKETFGKLFA